MGRLVRRYIRTSHLEVSNYIAIAGTSEGMKSAVYTNLAAGILNLVGVHAKTSTPTGKNQGGGYQYGIYVENEVLGDAVHAGLFEGMRIEQYVESGTTFASATVYGLHIANSISKAPSSYSFIRMSEDGTVTVNAVFLITKAPAAQINYLLEVTGGSNMWEAVGIPSGNGGWLKIRVPGQDRYIPLYTTPP
jgi:hypothetical protein